MGLCGTKLQNEPDYSLSNISNTSSPIPVKHDIIDNIKNDDIGSDPDINDIDCRKSSDESLFSSFGFEEHIENDDNERIMMNYNNNKDQAKNIQNERLIKSHFNRTLFSEDITYEYRMNCNLNINSNEEIIPNWILRLTVENITKFYAETLEKWRETKTENDDRFIIPYQFGKVMTPKVFTSLINNILQRPSILSDQESICSENACNFLCIPYDIRFIIQYNPDSYISDDIDADNNIYGDIIRCNEDKYKYLCGDTAVYKHNYEYDDCCQFYDEPQITCYSYWVRSLHDKGVDFLFNITSNNIFYIIMSDLSYNIAQIIQNNTCLDKNCAWVLTDYLPKYLLFNHEDERCNAQIIYKYDPRPFINTDNDYDDTEQQDNDYDDIGQFVLDTIDNKLLQRHDITNINELKLFCQTICDQHISIPCIPEMSASVSEYIESISKSNGPTTSAISPPNLSQNAYSIHKKEEDEEEEEEDDDNIYNEEEEENDKIRCFFTAFIDEEGDDDINLFQWLTSLQKLKINLTEKEIVNAFRFMLQQNEDGEDYIDFVDFTNFCQSHIDNDAVKRTQQLLNNFITRNK